MTFFFFTALLKNKFNLTKDLVLLEYSSLLSDSWPDIFLCSANHRERVWRAVRGWHVSAARAEAPLWEDTR